MSNQNKVVVSSFLLAAVRLLQRTLGLISTLILARVLLPEDFGIVAICLIVLQLANLLANTGIHQYIPQKDTVDSEDLNTAWSLDICLKFFLWMLLVLLAPVIGKFYDNPDVSDAIRVFSIVLFLNALMNPGFHLLRRELKYRKIFWLTLTQKICSFLVVVGLAIAVESFWAIIVGDIVSSLVGIVGSYKLHKHRPRITFSRAREQWDFSKWLIAKSIASFFRTEADQILVSKFFSLGDLGAYNVIRGLSVMPVTDVVVPATEPLLASFSRLKNNINYLGHQLRLSLMIICIMIVPFCFFIFLFSDPIIALALGEKWSDYGTLLSNLAVLVFGFSLGSTLGHFFIALGKVRLVFFYNVLALIFVVGFLLVIGSDTLAEFALFRGLLGLISTLVWLGLALKYSESNPFRFVVVILPVFVSATIAGYLSNSTALSDSSLLVNLMSSAILFTLFYSLSICIFYFLGFRKIREWQHLCELVWNALSKGFRRYKVSG